MSSPGKRKSVPNKRQKVAKDPSCDDRQAELITAVKEEARLESKLANARARTKEARKRLRDAGEAEFDSLLYVGKDSLSHVLKFLDIKMLGRWSRLAKPLDPLLMLPGSTTRKNTLVNPTLQKLVLMFERG